MGCRICCFQSDVRHYSESFPEEGSGASATIRVSVREGPSRERRLCTCGQRLADGVMVNALRTNRRVLVGQARGVGLARKKRRSGSRARGNAKKRNLNGEALWLVKGGKSYSK